MKPIHPRERIRIPIHSFSIHSMSVFSSICFLRTVLLELYIALEWSNLKLHPLLPPVGYSHFLTWTHLCLSLAGLFLDPGCPEPLLDYPTSLWSLRYSQSYGVCITFNPTVLMEFISLPLNTSLLMHRYWPFEPHLLHLHHLECAYERMNADLTTFRQFSHGSSMLNLLEVKDLLVLGLTMVLSTSKWPK